MTPEIGIGITKLDQIAIVVKDLTRATAFYKDVLQLPHMFSVENQLAFFDCGGVRIMLSRPETPELDHPSSILYFKVPDIHRAHGILVEREVRIEDPPHLIAKMGTYDLWMSFFRDSENNLLALSSDVPSEEPN
jgi:catechol 2,3-dioxygenase-like lactoylglutathione lyase family enzyme